MSEAQQTRLEFPFRRTSPVPFILGLPVLLFFLLYKDTPVTMRNLSAVVLLIALVFFIVTRGRFKGIFIEEGVLKVTNGLRTIQSLSIDSIEKISKEGGAFAIDYKDEKSGKRTRLSVLKNKFSEETWQDLSRKLSSLR